MKNVSLSVSENRDKRTKPRLSLSGFLGNRDKRTKKLSLSLSLLRAKIGTKGQTHPYGVCPCPSKIGTSGQTHPLKGGLSLSRARGTGTGGLAAAPPVTLSPDRAKRPQKRKRENDMSKQNQMSICGPAVMSAGVSEEFATWLDDLAEATGTSRADHVRAALLMYAEHLCSDDD